MKNFFYFIWFAILAICLFPFACIFMFLSIFNYDFFWKKIWNGFIDKLEKYHFPHEKYSDDPDFEKWYRKLKGGNDGVILFFENTI